MDKLIVKKSGNLKGSLSIHSAKNAVLPIMAASVLSDGNCVIEHVPEISDIFVMIEILKGFGFNASFQSNCVNIKYSGIKKSIGNYDLAGQIRASFLVAGPMLGRFGKCVIPLPGGCSIGSRPVDLHLKGFSALGADINIEHGYVYLSGENLFGNKIYLDYPSVGATENIIMASVYAKGITTIENAASEPEIVDLVQYLNKMGADIKGAGTATIKIKGVDSLSAVRYTPIPDRIEAGTIMTAAAACGGEVSLLNIMPEHLKPVIAKLKEIGVVIEDVLGGIKITSKGHEGLLATDISTGPYPGFPTDLQAQFMGLLCGCEGQSVITETVFENRFRHVPELIRMGCKIKTEGKSAFITGNQNLSGAEIAATDLRAGAALIIAGLMANGTTEISDIHHIDRGYSNIHGMLSSIGANIERSADINNETALYSAIR